MTVKELKKYILDNDKLFDVLEHIGCHGIKKCNDKYIQCGIKDGDSATSTTVFLDDYIGVNAWSRNIKSEEQTSQADLINLVAYSLGMEYKSAKNYLIGFLGLENGSSAPRKHDPISFFRKSICKAKRETAKKEQVYYDVDILKEYLDMPHIDLIKNDGLIDLNVLKKYRVMFDQRTGRVLFPHFKHDDSTKIAGIVGRTTNPAYKELKINKYMSMLPTRYDKTLNLYALCWNIDYIKEKDEIIVVEAEKSVMKADMFGDMNCVAVGCHSISKEQKKIILGLNIKNIVIAFDSDVDEETIRKECDEFYDFMNVFYIKDNWKLLGEKDSPMDRGYKRWKFLYNHKIKYKR